jgi:hypothetical protein
MIHFIKKNYRPIVICGFLNTLKAVLCDQFGVLIAITE